MLILHLLFNFRPNNSSLEEFSKTLINLSEQVISKMIPAITQAMNEAQQQQNTKDEQRLKIDDVFLVGGGSKHPKVKESVINYFATLGQNVRIVSSQKPQLSVSRGAALYSYYVALGRLPMADTVRQNLYLEFPDGSKEPLVKVGDKVPFKRPKSYFIKLDIRTSEINLKLLRKNPETGSTETYGERLLQFEQEYQVGTEIRLDVFLDFRQHVTITAYPRHKKDAARDGVIREPLS